MSGISFFTKADTNELIASIDPLLWEGVCSEEIIAAHAREAGYTGYAFNAGEIVHLSKVIIDAKNSGNMDVIEHSVAVEPESSATISLATDQMSASLTVVANPDAPQATYQEIKALLHRKGIVRGISKKRIQHLLNSALEGDAGKEYTDVIAIGLPPRDGKPSRVVPLVPNALDRILRPQESGDDKVDMRNLGDVLCVSANKPVAKRISPSKGRIGYTVTNKPLSPNKGEWQEVKLGNNTQLAEHDENLILSSLAGQPKFENNVMTIDDTFVTKGVNVGTGNVNYEGAVIVNGDVTENMQIIAQGDVTINGFVESAYIKAGGDIIITQGATGKMNDEDCRLIADGSVFIQHGQGLDVSTGKDLNVKRQLAYSRVLCKGHLYVGDPDNPTGNLFASKITAYNSVRAGSVGAVSGSSLEIDYSDAYNGLIKRLDAISELLDGLASVNADHEIKLSKMNAKEFPKYLHKKLRKLDKTIGKERSLLTWLRKVQGDLEQAKKDFENNARVIANKELFPGVVVRLNKRIFRQQKETMKSRIVLVGGNWEYQPIIK
ncbi:DUF342 domain-containing protein [Glaciecola siphonariae]|uniref:DUF342 domain-containing protein n=1 Tax=Glaciecola siphonariae TaxID=521012 RepID=A0ABV9LUH2_9ALTE